MDVKAASHGSSTDSPETYKPQGRIRSLEEEPVVELTSNQQDMLADSQEAPAEPSNIGQAQIDATFEHLMKQYRQPVTTQGDDQTTDRDAFGN